MPSSGKLLANLFVTHDSPGSRQVQRAVHDSYKRLLSRAMETEIRLNSKRHADATAIEIFAASHGVKAYNGLDVMNHYNIDPELGDMDDFRRVIRMAHDKGIAVIVFVNIGYFSKDAPDWIEACKDKKAGRETNKVKWFLWADNENAAIPPITITGTPSDHPACLNALRISWNVARCCTVIPCFFAYT